MDFEVIEEEYMSETNEVRNQIRSTLDDDSYISTLYNDTASAQKNNYSVFEATVACFSPHTPSLFYLTTLSWIVTYVLGAYVLHRLLLVSRWTRTTDDDDDYDDDEYDDDEYTTTAKTNDSCDVGHAKHVAHRLQQELPDAVSLDADDAHVTLSSMHCSLTIDVVKQYLDLTKLVEVLQQHGCTLTGMAATDYPNYRNLSVRIPLSKNKTMIDSSSSAPRHSCCTSLLTLLYSAAIYLSWTAVFGYATIQYCTVGI